MSKRFLALSVLLAVTGTFWGLYYHGAAHIIGIDTQASEEYAFFSGFGTWILAAAGYTGVILTALHTLNCHNHGCPRPGKYPVAGGQYKVCRRHHREITGHPRHLTTEFLKKLHAEHLERAG